ncbi:MAG TPA: ABC transporter permease [Gemmatimonadaceae bacterium]|nr:ABC transporter permease [Casimicrobiaceae bacterium]HWG33887.1 ABC transporter permease [Gemmatimonadaceae bacterium]
MPGPNIIATELAGADTAATAVIDAPLGLGKTTRQAAFNFVAGLAILFALWWLGIELLARSSSTAYFASFGPLPALRAMGGMWRSGQIQSAVWSSGWRLATGLLIAIAVGAPIGVLIGRVRIFRELSNAPFQLLRMISPLSWEPIAVIVFIGWDSAIIFLITIAAVWPVIFSTAAGLAKVDPNWFKVARNLGASRWQILTQIIVRAITFDVLTGLRLALGVAWIVLVPAEFFGVTSGLGYSIENARESINYDQLMAMVLVVGAIGYLLDGCIVQLIRRYGWQRHS